jgi:AraC-like DNA-binding protein
MADLRVIVDSRYTVELRGPVPGSKQLLTLSAQPLFQIAHRPGGATLLLNPNTTLSLQTPALLLIRLAPVLLYETATRLRLNRPGTELLFRHPAKEIVNDQRLRTMLDAISSEVSAGGPGWREMIKALVEQLTLHLLRTQINTPRSDEIELSRVGVVDRRVRRAVEFMHDQCHRDLSLSEIAASAYLSPFHFARLFRTLTGATPHAYLGALRIERARRLLAETDLSIGEVGARVGYSSQSHFTTVFREATGLTPKLFRQASQGE